MANTYYCTITAMLRCRKPKALQKTLVDFLNEDPFSFTSIAGVLY